MMDDDDQTVGTLQTLRTTRTARTSRTTATKRAEIDALFDDLLGDRDEDKGDGEAGGWIEENDNTRNGGRRRNGGGGDDDDFMRQMHGTSGESVVSAASGLPSVNVPITGNGHRSRRSQQQMDDDELLFGDDGHGGNGGHADDNKYARKAAAAVGSGPAAGGLFSTGLNAIGQSFGSSSGYARSKKNDDASRGSGDGRYKSSYVSTLKGDGGGGVASRRRSGYHGSGEGGASMYGDATHRSDGSNSVVTHGVSSILESMGLGDDATTTRRRNKPGELDGFLANQSEVARGNADINGAFAPSSFPFSRHNSRSKPGTMVHLRAGMIMLSLIGLVYSAVQLSVVVKHERGSRGDRYSRLPGGKVRPLPAGTLAEHDEGMDRPLSEKALNSLRGKASSAGDMMGMAAAPATGGNAAGLPKPEGLSTGDLGPVDELPGLGGGGLKGAGFADAVDPSVKALVTEHMPFQYDYVADLSSRYTKKGMEAFMKETPIFWHVPRSGGRMIIDLMSKCHSIKYSVVTADNLDDARTALQDPDHDGVIVSSLVHETMHLLDSDHYARMFTFLRHPIERAASVYENHHKSHEQISKMTFEEYAKSKYAENNWMVRYLSGKTSGEVTNDHLSVAKEVLRRKFVIGLMDQKEESAKRVQQFFAPKWDPNGEGMEEGCRSMVVNDVESQSSVKEGNQAWNLLVWQNKLDMKLFEYAQQLFAQQGEDLFGRIRKA